MPTAGNTGRTGVPLIPNASGQLPHGGPRLTWPRLQSRQVARQAIALLGLSCVVGAETIPAPSPREVSAVLGVAALMIASALALFEGGASRAGAAGGRGRATAPASNRVWRWTFVGLACLGVLVVQTWFHSGTVIAGGDIAPPIGTAWLSHLFSPFAWSGGTLGGPAQGEGEVPWAAVVWIVHLAGGSGALAQRIWLSGLVAGVLVSAGALARSLDFGPLAGISAAFLYCFNPVMLSEVGVNDVYLVAMVLLAALPAVLLAYARGRMALWTALVALVLAAPFVGFAYFSPPLVGMIALTTAATPLLAGVRFGWPAARRALRLLLVGGALLIGVSAYWLIPARVGLGIVATGKLASLSAWAFTEQRATLPNALWLNTTWGWRYAAYYPYSIDFARLPLGLVRPLLPLLAFSVLAARSPVGWASRRLTKALGAIALPTLVVLILSTGTLAPGNVLFDPLYYHFPGGWLLREPGRFLMFAALGYAVLAASLIEHLRIGRIRDRLPVAHAHIRVRAAPSTASVSMMAVLLITGLASGFPVWTGALVPGPRQGFPSDHVTVPSYWGATTRYLNSQAPVGSLLVLPPDDFYAMPYRWYYGVDGFITNLLERHVVDPSPQSYDNVSKGLLASVDLEASALLARDWPEATRVLQAIGTPLILVRGDIEAHFPTRHIVSPAALATSLAEDPYMRLLHRDGPLTIYGVRTPLRQLSNFATVDTSNPDLRALSLLPPDTALVTAQPVPGHTALLQLPPVATWHLGAAALSTTVGERPDWLYSTTVLGLSSGASSVQDGVKARQVIGSGGAHTLQIYLPVGQSLISDGNFTTGPWGPVGNCDAVSPVRTPNFLRARVLSHAGPQGTPALQLTATVDGACEATSVLWHGGPMLVDLSARSVLGAPPQVCLWESPLQRCASISPLQSGSAWHRYEMTVEPDPGTTSISLFLYAFAQNPGQPTVEQYAGVVVRALPYAPSVDVLAHPTTEPGRVRLLAYPTGYSPGWEGPPNSTHVVVDGIRNGWLTSSRTLTVPRVRYIPIANEHRYELAFAATMLLLSALLAVLSRSWSNRVELSRR